ncbi:MAG: heavy metal-associated domain-containing protein [Thermoprotei archaeon]
MGVQKKVAVIRVGGMHCGGCARNVEAALSKLAGVGNVRVNLEEGQVSLEFDPGRVGLEEVRRAIRKAGYIPGVERVGV